MQINKSPFLSDSWYIEQNDIFAKEAWLNGDLVWAYTLPLTSFTPVTYTAGVWSDIAFCEETGDLLISGTNRLSYSNDDGETWGAPYSLLGPKFHDAFNTIACGVSGTNHSWVTVENQQAGSLPSQYKVSKAENYYVSNAMPPTGPSNWNRYYMPFPLSGGLDFVEMIYSDYWERFIAIGQPLLINFGNQYDPITQETTDIATSLIGLSSIIGGYLPSSSTTLNGTWLSAGFFIGNTPTMADGGYSDVLEVSAFANHRIVACGSGGFTKFGYSDDGGATWNKAPYPATGGADSLQNLHTWNSLAYGQDGGVVLPLSGRVIATNANTAFVDNANPPHPTKPFAYSDDGINWVGTGLNIAQRGWGPAIYKNGWFVVFPAGGSAAGWMAFSKNGIDWKSINMLPPDLDNTGYTDLTITNNRFIAITRNSIVALADYYYPKTIDNNNDPYFNNVSLLLHMDGTNGSQTFIDSSPNNLTLTVNGNTQISTAITPKFGTACGYFDNLNPTGLETNSISLGLNDFTLEGWIYHIPGGNDPIFNQGNVDVSGAFFVTLDTGNRLVLYADNNVRFTSTATVPNSQWTYIAVTRSSGTYYFFINGVLDGTYTGSHNHTQLPFKIGDGYGGVRFWSGYMDDIRVTEGVARYTSNFTPPTQPFPNS